jgi:hypothetical protein
VYGTGNYNSGILGQGNMPGIQTTWVQVIMPNNDLVSNMNVWSSDDTNANFTAFFLNNFGTLYTVGHTGDFTSGTDLTPFAGDTTSNICNVVRVPIN